LPPDDITLPPPGLQTPISQQPTGEPTPTGAWVDLSSYDNSSFDPGRGLLVRTLWYYTSLLLFESGWMPSSGLKCRVLRWFGATIGRGVVIKPNVRIKFPWRLSIGDHCWIGQEAWIDNMAEVRIGNHSCLSQQVYLCTGSHDHRRRGFDLITRPITLGAGSWIGARATLLPGITVGENGLVAGGSIVSRDVEPGAVVAGNPARQIARREPPT
jgi:putative colanic acid biosynthesis acetyltransferase WcaF